MSRDTLKPPPGTSYGQRGRRVRCQCCDGLVSIRPLQIWQHRYTTEAVKARLRILFCDRDGAVVQQVGREKVDPLWGLSYVDLLKSYRRVKP